MTFNSPEYALLLLAVVAVYYRLGLRAQNGLLLAASYLFYGTWDERFLALICASTYVDFASGQLMGRGRLAGRRLWAANALLIGGTLAFVTFDVRVLFTPGADALVSFTGVRGLALLLAAGLAALVTAAAPFLERLPDAARRRACLGLSLTSNLGLLGFFKYFNFFAESTTELLRAIGFSASPLVLHVILPIGLSFYTFQSLAYAVDVYRKRIEPEDELLRFALFVAYFPQLVAGPIVRAGTLLPQFSRPRRFDSAGLWSGLRLILIGLLKKVAIADAVSGSVDSVFASAATASSIDVLAAVVLFSIQIACDFSGYTDIARGSSRLLGVELDRNFDFPYLARNPQEFWRRWHITLSDWLRDYVYVPLGGNRGGRMHGYRNAMITMLLGGLWHGAAWNFVLWGGLHGLAICAHRIARPRLARLAFLQTRAGAALCALACCVFVGYGWLLFRAHALADIVHLTRTLVALPWSPGRLGMPRPTAAFFLAFPALFAFLALDSKRWRAALFDFAPVRGAAYAVMLLALFLAAGQDAPAEFIYFQF